MFRGSRWRGRFGQHNSQPESSRVHPLALYIPVVNGLDRIKDGVCGIITGICLQVHFVPHAY
jgi:hypothetical protein